MSGSDYIIRPEAPSDYRAAEELNTMYCTASGNGKSSCRSWIWLWKKTESSSDT